MKNSISLEHKRQYEEIKKTLSAIGARESNFIRVELLFFEAMTVAREYGDDIASNGLLAAFKKLQANQYQETKALFRKSEQRERVIRRFISCLKSTITAGTKNAFFQPQLA
jgi:hypothetical protein